MAHRFQSKPPEKALYKKQKQNPLQISLPANQWGSQTSRTDSYRGVPHSSSREVGAVDFPGVLTELTQQV